MYMYAVPVKLKVEALHPYRLLLMGISDSPYLIWKLSSAEL